MKHESGREVWIGGWRLALDTSWDGRGDDLYLPADARCVREGDALLLSVWEGGVPLPSKFRAELNRLYTGQREAEGRVGFIINEALRGSSPLAQAERGEHEAIRD